MQVESRKIANLEIHTLLCRSKLLFLPRSSQWNLEKIKEKKIIDRIKWPRAFCRFLEEKNHG